MPRPTRSDLAEQFYHVVARGNQRQTLFRREQDYQIYLDLIKTGSLQFGLNVFHYVLMPNHIHLLVQPRQNGSLGKTFHWVQRKFAYWFQKQNGSEGAVWQGRYWNSLIEDEAYLLVCGRYIELNPVRGGLVKKPDEYRWSSARIYLREIWDPWMHPDPAFLSLGTTQPERIARYREFLQEPFQKPSQQVDEWAFWNRARIGNQVVPG